MNDELIPVEAPMKNLVVREQSGVDFAREAIVAQTIAEVQAGYVLAMKDPRDLTKATADMLEACDDFAFAQSAYYRIPYKDKRKNRKVFVRGESIRFAEEAALHFRHLHRTATILFDDDNKRVIAVTVRDLQANNGVTQTAEIIKKDLWGNQLELKTAAERAKLERNCIMKLLPVAFKRHAAAKIAEVVREKAFAAKDRLVSGMAKYGVKPDQIKKYFGVDPKDMSPEQCVELLEIGTAIKDRIASWNDFASGEADHVGPGLTLNDFKPKEEVPKENTTADAASPEGGSLFPENYIETIWYEFSGGLSAKAKKKAVELVAKLYKVETIDQVKAGPDDFRYYLDNEVMPELEKQGLVG